MQAVREHASIDEVAHRHEQTPSGQTKHNDSIASTNSPAATVSLEGTLFLTLFAATIGEVLKKALAWPATTRIVRHGLARTRRRSRHRGGY